MKLTLLFSKFSPSSKLYKSFFILPFFILTHVNADINSLPKVFTDPYQILSAHFKAIGGLDKLKKQKIIYSEGEVIFADMLGYFKSWTQSDLLYRNEINYPAFSTIEGDDGKQMWMIDLNKKKLILKDDKTIKRRRIRELSNQYDYLNVKSQFFKLNYVGIENVNGKECYVIETRNTLNKDVSYDYFSIKNFFLLKSITQEPYLKYVTWYSDFRKTDGTTSAFHSRATISPTGKEIITQINTLKINKNIPPVIFTIPSGDVKDYHFSKGHHAESIPFVLAENNIYLPVKIQGKEHYWIIDSGADVSVIDADYAKKISLKSQGKLLGNATNSLVEFKFVNLKEFEVKGITFFEQTILSYQNLADNFYEPDAVGILGYDFLSRFITKIDYAKQLISFYDPEFFNYTGLGTRINTPLQDKLFIVPMTFDGLYNGNYALDLGSFNLSMNYPFAEKNGFIDKKGVLRLSSDIAGIFYEQQIKSTSIEVAGYTINNELVNFPIEKGKGTNSDEKFDGFIGNSLLRHFVLYLDYNQQQLIFEQGDHFNRMFPADKSGMTIGRSLNNMPEVFYVAGNTPAEKAGIQVGDIILAIDNYKTKALSNITKIVEMLRAESGTSYQILVKREEKEIELTLKLQSLF